MTIKEANRWAVEKLKNKKISSAYLDAEVLLCYILNITNVTPKKTRQAPVTNMTKEWVYVNPAYRLPSTVYNKYKKLIERRIKKEPVAYITGKKEFYGMDFYITKDVLIPRPETELLIEEVGCHMSHVTSPLTIIDVGTGSGCIAITLAKKIAISNKQLVIFATDISKKALNVAQINAKKHKVLNKITFIQGDLLKPLITNHQSLVPNIIVANLPYISDEEMEKLPNDIKKFEPKITLCGGKEGLDFYKKLLFQSRKILNRNGKIFLEISHNQTKLIKKTAKKNFPKCKIEVKKDYTGLDRVVSISP